MLGSFTIQGPSSVAIALLWIFYGVMVVAIVGLVVSILTKIFGRRQ